MIVLDTSGLLAALDASDRHHRRSAQVLRRSGEPRLLSPFVLAELDYLLTTRVSGAAARALLDEIARGAYRLEPFANADVEEALAVMDRHRGLDIDLADASLVVLAERYGTIDILTLDERHFRSLRTSRGRPFRLLPLDHA